MDSKRRVDHLILVAERRELAPLINKLSVINDRYVEGQFGPVQVGVYITGVGKRAVKRSQQQLNDFVAADTVWDVGNVGALGLLPRGLIVRVGRVIGQNGQVSHELDAQSPFSLVTVNSLQDKSRLASQYPHADIVDMEAAHWLEVYPACRVVKIVLDRRQDQLHVAANGRLSLMWCWRIHQNACRLSRVLEHEMMSGIFE